MIKKFKIFKNKITQPGNFKFNDKLTIWNLYKQLKYLNDEFINKKYLIKIKHIF